jgi:aerobic-type carbon monoxide dehydrogenase small subunit (CoxS/CutS family)
MNGARVTVEVADDVRLLWVLRLPATIGADLDGLRDIRRCGTYQRIRTAIRKGEARM